MRHHPRALAAVSALTLALTLAAPTTARACGGFFCDNVNPVVQSAERVLFRINDDGTTTVIVEIQYEGPPSNFGWVLPVSSALTIGDVGTAPAGLFDALEEVTAPIFERPSEGGGGSYDQEAGGCSGLRGGGSDVGDPSPPDTSGVQVVGAAVVGPYAIELITAEGGQNLSNWLLLNGYQIPPSAIGAMDHYIDLGMAFVGLKLTADQPRGPIDALSFTVPGTVPSLPLILTAVAAATDMEIIAYVAAPGRHVPGNGEDLDFDYQSVEWTDAEETDYRQKLLLAINGVGDQAWNTEFAARLLDPVVIVDTVIDEVLDRDDYLTRFHAFMSADDMTRDPYWVPSASAADVDNHHTLYGGYGAEVPGERPLAGFAGLAWLLAPVLLARPRRRRRG